MHVGKETQKTGGMSVWKRKREIDRQKVRIYALILKLYALHHLSTGVFASYGLCGRC